MINGFVWTSSSEFGSKIVLKKDSVKKLNRCWRVRLLSFSAILREHEIPEPQPSWEPVWDEHPVVSICLEQPYLPQVETWAWAMAAKAAIVKSFILTLFQSFDFKYQITQVLKVSPDESVPWNWVARWHHRKFINWESAMCCDLYSYIGKSNKSWRWIR